MRTVIQVILVEVNIILIGAIELDLYFNGTVGLNLSRHNEYIGHRCTRVLVGLNLV